MILNPYSMLIRRFTLIILSFIAICLNTNAQIAFTNQYGGTYNEDGRWMEQTADSGYILTGSTVTFSNGQTDMWLVKADKYGQQSWTKSFGGPAFDFANKVKKTTDGGYVICGLTNSIGAGNNDGYLVKTDSSGNMQWQQTYGDSGIQEIEDIILTSDGGYAMLGISVSGNTQYYDMWLIKTDAMGTLQWSQVIGGIGYEIGNALQQTPDGGYVLCGQTYSSGVVNGGGSFSGDYIMIKTDAIGNVQWQKTYGGPGVDEAHHVCLTPDGGYMLIGDADTVNTRALGQTDIWLVKTNSTGDTLWTKTYGGTKKDGGKTVELTSDGGYILAGITRSFGLINPDYYLVKIDSIGTLQWSQHYGLGYHDHAYHAIETLDSGFAIFGYARNSSNKMNFYLVKVGSDGGVTKDLAIERIISPTPTVCQNNASTVSIAIINNGDTNENLIVAEVQFTGSLGTQTVIDTLVPYLNPDLTAILNFDQHVNLLAGETYEVTAFLRHRTNDISFTNDTISMTVTVLDPSVAPTTVGAASCAPASLSLSATATDTVFWYDAPAGGNLVGKGTTFQTPVLNSTTSYYAESQTGSGHFTGAPNRNMGTGGYPGVSGYLLFDSRTNFKLVSVKVYAQNAGNKIIELRDADGIVLQTRSVYIPNGEQRIILDFDIPPGIDFQLGVQGSNSGLYRNSTGAQYPYDVSRVVEIYSSSNGLNYYFFFYDWEIFVPFENCISSRALATAAIGSNAIAVNGERCGEGSVDVTVNNASSVSWYDQPTGGTLLGSSNTYTTPILNNSTTYYAAVDNCATRTPVDAIINQYSLDPITIDGRNCGPGNVTVIAQSADPIKWYDTIGGNMILANDTLITAFLNNTTTYYAVAGSICPSNPVAAQAIINDNTPPTTTSGENCGEGSVLLVASGPDPIEWYDAPTGGTLLAIGDSLHTPTIASTTTFYAQAINACAIPRIGADATIYALPNINLGNDTTLLPGSSYTLNAGSGFVNYLWSTGETSSLITVNSSNTYFVSIEDVKGCTNSDTIVVNFNTGIGDFLNSGIQLINLSQHSAIILSNQNLVLDQINVFNMNGALVLQQNNITLPYQLEMSEFSNGIYNVVIYNNNQPVIYKFNLNR